MRSEQSRLNWQRGGLMPATYLPLFLLAAVVLRASPRPVSCAGPLRFEPNRGQLDSRVRFSARLEGLTLFLTATEAVLASPGSSVRFRLEGARPAAILPLDPLTVYSNYFFGQDPRRWRAKVPSYGRIVYRGIYPGPAPPIPATCRSLILSSPA